MQYLYQFIHFWKKIAILHYYNMSSSFYAFIIIFDHDFIRFVLYTPIFVLTYTIFYRFKNSYI